MSKNKQYHLTKALVLQAIRDHYAAEGEYPNFRSGNVSHTDMGNSNCTWMLVHSQLIRGAVEGVEGTCTLVEFLESEFGVAPRKALLRDRAQLTRADVIKTVLAQIRDMGRRPPPKYQGEIAGGPLAGKMRWGGLMETLATRRKVEKALEDFRLPEIITYVIEALQAQGAEMSPPRGKSAGSEKITLPANLNEKKLITAVAKRMKGNAQNTSDAPEVQAKTVYLAMMRESFTQATCSDPATKIGEHTVEQINAAIAAKTFKGADAYMSAKEAKKLKCLLDFAVAAGAITIAAPRTPQSPLEQNLPPVSRFRI